MKTAFIFPGQGAQYPGMARDLWEKFDSVKALFILAGEVTGLDCQKILFESTPEELKQTDRTQIAITLANLCAAKAMKEKGITPDFVAGLSLGEFSALCLGGILSEDQVFSLVHKRGLIMDKTCKKLNEGNDKTAMAAVIGIGLEQINIALNKAGVKNVYAANNNSPVQVAISGMESGFAKAEEALKEAGARRIIRLSVAGPFHTPLMKEAAQNFGAILSDYAFHDPKIACYSNVTGKKIINGSEAKELAVSQITGNVLWVQEEQAMAVDGVGRLFETGPGPVLTGLWQAFVKSNESLASVVCQNAGTLEQIEKLQ